MKLASEAHMDYKLALLAFHRRRAKEKNLPMEQRRFHRQQAQILRKKTSQSKPLPFDWLKLCAAWS